MQAVCHECELIPEIALGMRKPQSCRSRLMQVDSLAIVSSWTCANHNHAEAGWEYKPDGHWRSLSYFLLMRTNNSGCLGITGLSGPITNNSFRIYMGFAYSMHWMYYMMYVCMCEHSHSVCIYGCVCMHVYM